MKKLILLAILLMIAVSCSTKNSASKSEITILFTSDEHGWYEVNERNSGYPGIAKHWNEIIYEVGRDNVLILSGGDNYTGYANSNITKGKNMVLMMNKMGYDFSAIGNHEFDFGAAELLSRINEADFKYLAANIIDKEKDSPVEWVKAFELKQVGESLVAVIGISNIHTPTEAYPPFVEDFEFEAPCEVISDIIPVVESYKPDIIIALTHQPSEDIQEIMPCIEKYGIDVVLCGHSHQENIIKEKNYIIMEQGSKLDNFGRIDLIIDNDKNRLIKYSGYIIKNDGATDEIIDVYAKAISADANNYLDIVIGKVAKTYSASSKEMSRLLCKSWLSEFKGSQFVFVNNGGIRQQLFAGEVTNGDIMGILPFENKMLMLNMTGKEIKKEVAENHSNFYPENLDLFADSLTYKVVINSYMYYSDTDFQKYDTIPTFYNDNYRVPILKWVAAKSDSGRVLIDDLLKN